MSDKAQVYAQTLSRMVQVPTVTGVDRKSFAAFRKVLAEEFPHVYSACEVIMPGGDGSDAIMFKWKGKASSRPLVLMAHQDVVPAEGEWKYPAFSGTIAEGICAIPTTRRPRDTARPIAVTGSRRTV